MRMPLLSFGLGHTDSFQKQRDAANSVSQAWPKREEVCECMCVMCVVGF